MPKRQVYLFAYDIRSPKTQNRVRRLLKAYATGGQKSLFECWLTPTEKLHLCEQLHDVLRKGDKLHYTQLPTHLSPQLFGLAKPLRYQYFIVD